MSSMNNKVSANNILSRPTDSMTRILNKMREFHGVMNTDYSSLHDIKVMGSEGREESLKERAFMKMKDTYKSKDSPFVSEVFSDKVLSKPGMRRKALNCGYQESQLREAKRRFVLAMDLIKVSSQGLTVNWQYFSTRTHMAGGSRDFFLYPSDVSFMTQGRYDISDPSKDIPNGLSKATKDIRQLVRDTPIGDDLHNCVLYFLDKYGKYNDKNESPLVWLPIKLYESLLSRGYYKYMKDAEYISKLRGGENRDRYDAAIYWMQREIQTIADIRPKLAKELVGLIQTTYYQYEIEDALADLDKNWLTPEDKPGIAPDGITLWEPDDEIDSKSITLVIENLIARVAQDAVGSISKTIAALSGFYEEYKKYDLPRGKGNRTDNGKSRKPAVSYFFNKLGKDVIKGRVASGVFTDRQIEDAYRVLDPNSFYRLRSSGILSKIKKVNDSGILSIFSLAVSLSRLGLTAAQARDLQKTGDLSTEEAVNLALRTMASISVIGDFVGFIEKLSKKTPRPILQSAFRFLYFTEVNPRIYDLSTGFIWTKISPGKQAALPRDVMTNIRKFQVHRMDEFLWISDGTRIDILFDKVEAKQGKVLTYKNDINYRSISKTAINNEAAQLLRHQRREESKT